MGEQTLGVEQRRTLRQIAEAVRVEQRPGRLREMLDVGDEVIEAMEHYAHDLYRHGRIERAGTIIEGVLALDHTRYYPYLLVGDIALQKGAWADAARCFEAAVNFCDTPTAMLFGKLGEAHLRAGELETSAAYLRRAVAAGPPDQKYVRRSEVILESMVDTVEAVTSEN